MTGRTDPWEAMAQNDDSDDDYIPSGADGTDDYDQEIGEEVDNYQDIEEDDSNENELGNLVFSP